MNGYFFVCCASYSDQSKLMYDHGFILYQKLKKRNRFRIWNEISGIPWCELRDYSNFMIIPNPLNSLRRRILRKLLRWCKIFANINTVQAFYLCFILGSFMHIFQYKKLWFGFFLHFFSPKKEYKIFSFATCTVPYNNRRFFLINLISLSNEAKCKRLSYDRIRFIWRESDTTDIGWWKYLKFIVSWKVVVVTKFG